jgi:hypothetical protein
VAIATLAFGLLACGGAKEQPTTRSTAELPSNIGGLHRWDHVPVEFCVDSRTQGFVSTAEFQQLVVRAFETWGVPYHNQNTCATAAHRDDGVNEIGWGTLPPPALGSQIYEAGVTYLTYKNCAGGCSGGEKRGAISEADIVIESDAPQEFKSTRCLLGTLLHEVGHFLGLEHLPAPSIMQAEKSSCTLALTDSDRTPLAERYGAFASTASDGSRSVTPPAQARTNSSDDTEAVKALILYQLNLFRSRSWEEAYKTYAPRFQALCPYDQYRTINSTRSIDFSKVELNELAVRVDGDRAYATYGYTYAGTPTAPVTARDPDVYVRINGTWYDDIDTHTQCK